MTFDNFKADFISRVKDNTKKRWIRFGIVSLIFLLWVIWMGSPWLLLGWLLLFDIYITGYIPFTWWKRSKSAATRTVMSWVDAIVYTLVLVYFIFGFIGQNYTIPSSSLEKTLLTGDFLFVNKAVYGPRVPMTPVYFPLVHNEFPQWLGGGKSYLDNPSVGYKRLKGLRSVEAGDIVVFNFPAGDTVMSKVSNPDYYTLKRVYGEAALAGESERFGHKIWRPVDRRENYVKRAVGLPGQYLKIVDGVIYVRNYDEAEFRPLEIVPEKVQFNYFYQAAYPLTAEDFEQLGISKDDRNYADVTSVTPEQLAELGYKVNADGSVPPIYVSPMTPEMVQTAQADPRIIKIEQQTAVPEEVYSLYPEAISAEWTRADYGGSAGIFIPKKGMKIRLTPGVWKMLERVIRVYENNPDAEMRDGKFYINGQQTDTYTFKMDYYFMMGDNRDNSLDSRYWGLVPEDHIVGTPWRVLISLDKDKSLTEGKIRWNRIFLDANPDK